MHQQVAKPETRVAHTARALAQLSLAHDEGSFLGAETELLQRLGVSRPTLRQAAKITENDRLISVRRGIRGGFYATRPDADDAIRTLANYLRLKGTTLGDVMALNRLVQEEASALACACHDEALIGQLAAFDGEVGRADTPTAAHEAERTFARLVAEMSGNPAMMVVMAIGFSFGMQEQGRRLFVDPAHREQARLLRHAVCRAILDRDVEIARVMTRRRAEVFAGWLSEDVARADGNG